jgi:hypothetical protein
MTSMPSELVLPASPPSQRWLVGRVGRVVRAAAMAIAAMVRPDVPRCRRLSRTALDCAER